MPAPHNPGDSVSWALPGNLPHAAEPMLPSPAGEPFDSPTHIYEVIWAGVRALMFIERGEVRVQDSYGRDATARYPELQVPRSHLNGSGIILDGAIVCLDDAGRPDFPRLHRRLVLNDDAEAALMAAEAPVTFQAFDILYRNGLSVMDEPLRRRKSLLRQTVRIQGTLAVPDFVEREGVAFFEAARAHGLEGVIAKERDSKYTPGVRSRSWLSMRVYQRSEFVIGGYTYGGAPRPGHGAPAAGPFTSLLIGQFDASGALRFVGEVSGGPRRRVGGRCRRRPRCDQVAGGALRRPHYGGPAGVLVPPRTGRDRPLRRVGPGRQTALPPARMAPAGRPG